MPLFDCGYFMEQDKVRAFVPEISKEDGLLALLFDIKDWLDDLSPDVRVKTPSPMSLCPIFDIFTASSGLT
jgi:hypothetical protein